MNVVAFLKEAHRENIANDGSFVRRLHNLQQRIHMYLPYRFRLISEVVLLRDDKLVEFLKGFQVFFLERVKVWGVTCSLS